MDLAFVERLIDLVSRSPVSEFELTRDGWSLRIVKASTPAADPDGPAPADPAPAPPAAVGPSEPGSVGVATHVVAAGLVGTFYRAQAPDQPAFVSVGDIVEEGQTLAIMEAMKTLIPVLADHAGRIEAILREDGTLVQAGDPLFTIAFER